MMLAFLYVDKEVTELQTDKYGHDKKHSHQSYKFSLMVLIHMFPSVIILFVDSDKHFLISHTIFYIDIKVFTSHNFLKDLLM